MMTGRRLLSPLAAVALWLGAGLPGPIASPARAEVCAVDETDRDVCLAAPSSSPRVPIPPTPQAQRGD